MWRAPPSTGFRSAAFFFAGGLYTRLPGGLQGPLNSAKLCSSRARGLSVSRDTLRRALTPELGCCRHRATPRRCPRLSALQKGRRVDPSSPGAVTLNQASD